MTTIIPNSKSTSKEEYDNYIKSYITKYCVSTRVGIGKYDKTFFKNFDDPKSYLNILKKEDADTRSLIYGISNPPHTVLDVNVVMELQND